jgi:heat shock protein HslJ
MTDRISCALRACAAIAVALSATFAQAQMRKEEEKELKPIGALFKNFPLDQTWQLRAINDKPIPAGLDVSLMIDANLRGSGFTGCNTWSATLYPVKEQHLLMGPPALTKKQCPKEVMAIELGFLTALIAQPTWDLVNGELLVKGKRGNLRFVRSL